MSFNGINRNSSFTNTNGTGFKTGGKKRHLGGNTSYSDPKRHKLAGLGIPVATPLVVKGDILPGPIVVAKPVLDGSRWQQPKKPSFREFSFNPNDPRKSASIPARPPHSKLPVSSFVSKTPFIPARKITQNFQGEIPQPVPKQTRPNPPKLKELVSEFLKNPTLEGITQLKALLPEIRTIQWKGSSENLTLKEKCCWDAILSNNEEAVRLVEALLGKDTSDYWSNKSQKNFFILRVMLKSCELGNDKILSVLLKKYKRRNTPINIKNFLKNEFDNTTSNKKSNKLYVDCMLQKYLIKYGIPVENTQEVRGKLLKAIFSFTKNTPKHDSWVLAECNAIFQNKFIHQTQYDDLYRFIVQRSHEYLRNKKKEESGYNPWDDLELYSPDPTNIRKEIFLYEARKSQGSKSIPGAEVSSFFSLLVEKSEFFQLMLCRYYVDVPNNNGLVEKMRFPVFLNKFLSNYSATTTKASTLEAAEDADLKRLATSETAKNFINFFSRTT